MTIYKNLMTGRTTRNVRVAQAWMKRGYKVVKWKEKIVFGG